MFLLKRHASAGHAAQLILDLFLTLAVAAPHRTDESGLRVCDLFEFFLRGSCVGHVLHAFLRSLEHVVLDLFQNFLHLRSDSFKRRDDLLAGISADDHTLSLLDILRADLEAHRNSSHFLVRELPAGALVRIIQSRADPGSAQGILQFAGLIENAFLLLLDRDDHRLDRRHSRRQFQSAVISVYHDDRADHTGRHPPGSLVAVFRFIVLTYILDLKRTCEPVSEVMAGSALQGFAVMHQRFDRIGCDGACKLLFIRLFAADDRDREEFFRKIRIHIQHLDRSLFGFLSSCMNGVSFLPQEFSGAQERSCRFLPAQD